MFIGIKLKCQMKNTLLTNYVSDTKAVKYVPCVFCTSSGPPIIAVITKQ